ncbi:MAG: hypothetical protein OEU36_23455 [Gammaproteobacteria bacterium]|nr:hypothetical protein [Gammaproteobacteria bacterium]
MTTTILEGAILILAITISVMSAFGVYSPARLINLVKSFWDRKGSIYFAVIVRLVLGALLILVAPSTKFPIPFEVLGWLMIVAAIIIPLVGRERIGRLLSWWEHRSSLAVRIWCVLGVVFGGFLILGVL